MFRRLILICIVAYIIYRFFKLCLVLWTNHLKKKYENYDKSKTTTIGGKTVKCDNCGAYAAEELSVNIKHNGDELYFCSVECKDAYLKKH